MSIPESVDHLAQALHEGFAKWFAHAEHSRNKLPSTREQWLSRGNLQQSTDSRRSKHQLKINSSVDTETAMASIKDSFYTE